MSSSAPLPISRSKTVERLSFAFRRHPSLHQAANVYGPLGMKGTLGQDLTQADSNPERDCVTMQAGSNGLPLSSRETQALRMVASGPHPTNDALLRSLLSLAAAGWACSLFCFWCGFFSGVLGFVLVEGELTGFFPRIDRIFPSSTSKRYSKG